MLAGSRSVRVAIYHQIDFQPTETAGCLHVLVADRSKLIFCLLGKKTEAAAAT
jgi:hypothetical protein